MSEKSTEVTNQQSQQTQQRRPQQYYNQHNQQRNYSRQQYQQYSYQKEQQQQQQRRYSNQRQNDSNNKSNKVQDDNLTTKEPLTASASNNYSKQVSSASAVDSFSHTSTNCVCCLHHLSTYVTFACMHYICLHCAVKLRIICEKTECPICRHVGEIVICSKEPLNSTTSLVETDLFQKLFKEYEQKNKPLIGGFYYDLDRIKHEYDELLSHRCKLCKDRLQFNTFNELDQHMKRAHQVFYCELCTANLKLFTFERKFYNRQLLAQHRREGDADDQSFKGHPNCSFCDERFFDRDELYRHLRKDHFFCNFCDADGHEKFYADCVELKKHFKASHYLCEIDECATNIDSREYSVFRSEIDYNAHKKTKHAKSKSEAKNFGKINIEFNISNPIRDRIRDRGTRNQNSEQESSDHRRQRQQKQNLREMYERFDGSNNDNNNNNNKSISPIVPVIPVVEEAVAEPINQSIITSEPLGDFAAATTWRDLISSGPIPRMKNDAEFPSLSNDKKFSSLASIGDAIAMQSNGNASGAWAVKKTKPVVKNDENKKENKTKKEAKSSKSSHQARALSAMDDNNESKLVNLKEFLQQPEQRNTSRETFQVINKKIDDENQQNDGGKIDKKKEKKLKNKLNKTENDANKSDDLVKSSIELPVKTTITTAPPPGFLKPVEQTVLSESSHESSQIVTNKNPPPGFNQPAIAKVRPPSPSPPPPPQPPAPIPSMDYVKPQNYDKRNNDLTLEVISLLDGSQYNLFKSLSIDYHAKKLSAKVYLERCKGLFLNNSEKYKKFINLLQEMIILLPDISLQNQLYDEYLLLIQHKQHQIQQNQKAEVKLAWADSKSKTQQQSNLVNSQLVNCINCNQLLSNNEVHSHLKIAHSVNNNLVSKSEISIKKEKTTNINEEFPDLPMSSNVIFNNPQESLSLLKKKNKKFFKKL